MRGEILDFIELTNEGLISGDDGGRYTFTRADVQQPGLLRSGVKVDFVPVGGAATQIYPVAAGATATAAPAPGAFTPVPPPPVGRYDGPGEPDMSPLDFFVKCLRKYVDGQGRARRKEYWSFVLFEIIFFIPVWVLQMIAIATAAGSGGYGAGAAAGGGLLVLVSLVAALAGLALLLPGLCVSIRRVHDIGLTGWILLVAFVPFIGAVAILVMALLPSQEGPNEYGPYPKPTGALRPVVA